VSSIRGSETPTLAAAEVCLVPLRASDARELAPLLDDPELHTFIGGEPLTLQELEERYRRLEAGAPAGLEEQWFNWVIRRVEHGQAVGTAQATVRGMEAIVAWVIARCWQGRGYASDAARALVRWLRDENGLAVKAHIHPDHDASVRVARAAGLEPTKAWVEGERVWCAPPPEGGAP
jgi:RimJ/RimL family protein N-acetyltransferase